MDHVYLTGPQGTTIDVGSWIDLTRGGPDYGAKDLVVPAYAQNILSEGAAFAYDHEPPRHMVFPLTVPSGGVGGVSLDTVESLLHLCARPGGYIDIQPDGTATAAMTRFDLLGGRVNHDPYTVPVQRAGRRFLSLALDTQPFGYWPTWITLASQVVTFPFAADIPIAQASLIGDAPGLVELSVLPSVNGSAVGSSGRGVWTPAMVMWGIGGGPRPLFFDALSFATAAVWNATVRPDIAAPDGVQSWQVNADAMLAQANGSLFQHFTDAAVGSVPPGNYRMLLYARTGASGLAASGFGPVQLSVDTNVVAGLQGIPLGSAAAIATLAPGIASGAAASTYDDSAYGAQASAHFRMLDMGPVGVPSVPAGYTASSAFRFYMVAATLGPSPILSLGGFTLIPADNSGVLPPGDGLSRAGNKSGITIDAVGRTVIARPQAIGTTRQIDNLVDVYRGQFPRTSASTTRLTLAVGALPLASIALNGVATTAQLIHAPGAAFVSFRYRPRFRFLRGL